MDQRKSEFIPGIEGLRAIAILAVLINHLDSASLPGGYLGVDLFFVISGFVISRSLDLADTTSLKNYIIKFYSKRLKRLFPALLISILIITLISTLFFGGLAETTLGTGRAAIFGFSNLYLIHINTDYFGLGSEYNLFLPTWSLGIEEQFYFFFPLFLFWLKTKKKSIVGGMIIVFLFSFVTFLVAHYFSKNFQYYFPLSRLWELLMGCLVYYITLKHDYKFQKPIYIPILLALLALVFILPNLVSFLTTYRYFSVAAPVVCLISAGLMFLSSRINSPLLANSLLMYIGKISYSIYLYHFAVLKLINPGPSWGLRILSLVVVLIFSMISFHLIETPIRHKKWKKLGTKKLLGVVAAVLTLSFLVHHFATTFIVKDPFMYPTKAEFEIEQCNFIKMTMDCKLSSEGKPRLFFIGDSHSNALTPVMAKLHKLDHYEVYSLASMGLFTTTMDGYTREHVSEVAKKGIEYLSHNITPGSTIIITNQTMTWFSNTFNDDPELHKLTVNGKLLSHEEALKNYVSELKVFANSLKNRNVNLILTAPFPDFPLHPSKCYSPVMVAFGLDRTDSRCQTSRSEQEVRRKNIVDAFKVLASEEPNIKIFDPIDLICNELSCDSYRGSKPIYYDDDHINFNLTSEIYSKLSQVL